MISPFIVSYHDIENPENISVFDIDNERIGFSLGSDLKIFLTASRARELSDKIAFTLAAKAAGRVVAPDAGNPMQVEVAPLCRACNLPLAYVAGPDNGQTGMTCLTPGCGDEFEAVGEGNSAAL